MNVWVWIVGAAVQSTVSVLVSMYWRRAIHRNNVLIEQVLSGVEGAAINYGKGTRVNLAKYHKAIAAGTGGLLGGVLVYAESFDLEPVIGPLLPAQWRPLFGWLLGLLIVVGAVIASKKNADASPETSVQPAPPVAVEPVATIAQNRTIASLAKSTDDDPFWGGIPMGNAPSSPTGIVQLQPVPAASPL